MTAGPGRRRRAAARAPGGGSRPRCLRAPSPRRQAADAAVLLCAPLLLASLLGALPAGPGGRALRVANPAQAPAEVKNAATCARLAVLCSANWAGEEAWGERFTGIEAEWTVPAVTPTSVATEDLSVWIGLDGVPLFDGSASPPLIQLGTDAPAEDGRIGYEAWYELSPGAEIPLFQVSPGDRVRAEISEVVRGSDEWDLTIADLDSHLKWSLDDLYYQAPGESADAVVEASSLCGTGGACLTSQLEDFGSVRFGSLRFLATGGRPRLELDDMVDSSGAVVAYPTPGSASLTVTYGSPPPPATGTASVPLPPGFQALAVDPATGEVFVSSSASAATGTVTELSPAGAVLRSAPVPGAAGLAVWGGRLYVATPTGVVALLPSDLGAAGSFPVAGGLERGASLVEAAGALWSVGSSGRLVRVTPTGAVTPEALSAGARLVAGPGDPGSIFGFDPGPGPARIDRVVLSAGPPAIARSTVAHGPAGEEVRALKDAAVSPDGRLLFVAAGYPFELVGLEAAGLTATATTLPAAPYPTAVSTTAARGGEVAASFSTGGPTAVVVYRLSGRPAPPLAYELPLAGGPGYEEVRPGGLAFSPSGGRLYAVTTVASGDAIVGQRLTVLPTSPAAPPGGGYGALSVSVAGEVGGSAQLVSGACVSLYDPAGALAYGGPAAADGSFSLAEVVPGDYRLLVDPTCGGTLGSPYAAELLDGSAGPAGAARIAVAAGATTRLEVTLGPGARISGQVLDLSGPLVSGCVGLETPGGFPVQSTTVGAEGSFSFESLAPGAYLVEADPTCGGSQPSEDAIGFYGGPSPTTATSVSVGPGAAASGLRITLGPGATISGTLRAPGAASAGGVCVLAIAPGDSSPLASSVSAPGGAYSIGSLPAGTYALELDPTCAGRQPSDYGAAVVLATVGPGGTTAGVDATLPLRTAAESITSTSLPPGTVGLPYGAALEGTGTDGVVWKVTGRLPPGLRASPGGMITGTPTAAGEYPLEVSASDESVPAALPLRAQVVLTVASARASTLASGRPAGAARVRARRPGGASARAGVSRRRGRRR